MFSPTRKLACLTATAALVHFQVIPDGINIFQRFKNITGQDDRPDKFRYLTIANHMSFTGREGEHLHAGCASVPVTCIYSFFNITNDVVKC